MGVCVMSMVLVCPHCSSLSIKLCPVSGSPTLVLAGFGSVVGCSFSVALAVSWHQVALAQHEVEDTVHSFPQGGGPAAASACSSGGANLNITRRSGTVHGMGVTRAASF